MSNATNSRIEFSKIDRINREIKKVKNWISMLFVVAVTLAFAGCDDAKEVNSEGGDDKNVQQKDSQQQKDDQPKVAQPKDDDQKRPPESKPELAGGDQDENENTKAPKSRIFSSIGRAFLKGTSGNDSEADSTDQPTDGDQDKGN